MFVPKYLANHGTAMSLLYSKASDRSGTLPKNPPWKKNKHFPPKETFKTKILKGDCRINPPLPSIAASRYIKLQLFADVSFPIPIFLARLY